MSFITKILKRDASGITPMAQHYNPETGVEDYEPLYGRNNANRVEIFRADGNPISSMNRLYVDAQLSGSIPEGNNEIGKVRNTAPLATLDTLINAVSVESGGSCTANLSLTGMEKEIWVQVHIDQQPWTLGASYANYKGGSSHYTFYPVRNNVNIAYSSIYIGCVSLLVGQYMSTATGLTSLTSMEEAKQYIVYNHAPTVRVENASSNTATVTLKIMKVWR